MKKFVFIAVMVLSTIASGGRLQAVTMQVQQPTNLKHWIQTQFTAKAAPFTFVYNGQSSVQLLPTWKYSFQLVSDNANEIHCTVSYLDPQTHLRVKADITGYKDFQEVEWILYFLNEGEANTPILEQVLAIDTRMVNTMDGDFQLRYARGSSGEANDFEPMHQSLASHASLDLGADQGLSSETTLPFFLLQAPNQSGVVLSIGWSGSWQLHMQRNDTRSLSIRAGMPNTHLVLYPKEQIRTPLISFMFFKEENVIEAHNKFRRFITAHATPQVVVDNADKMIFGGFDWGDPEPCSEYTCLDEQVALAIVHRYQQFGLTPDVFWLDAGWYKGCTMPDGTPRFEKDNPLNDVNWGAYVGNWEIDPVRFPNGFKPISDEVHRLGCKFLVWFEPERVRPYTEIAVEHPEWCLHAKDFDHTYLFDMGNPEARRWITQRIGDIIENNGIDYYRQDCNTSLTAFWKSNETPDRQGIREIRHIEGLYDYWDQLRLRFPDLLIDNCAGGGRRIDLEALRRSVVLWRTDNTIRCEGHPTNMQNQTFGLNYFLPFQVGAVYESEPYHCMSALCSSLQVNFHLFESGYKLSDMQAGEQIYRQYARWFWADFYPLMGESTSMREDIWFAYQLNDPSTQSGIALAYRRYECNEPSCTLYLQQLRADAHYAVSINAGEDRIFTGQELMQGLPLSSTHKGEALIVRYTLK